MACERWIRNTLFFEPKCNDAPASAGSIPPLSCTIGRRTGPLLLIGATMRTLLVGLYCLIPATLIAAPIQDKGSGETAVEKTRKALQQKITIEIADKTLEQAVAELKDQTKINFTLDHQALAAMG